MVNFGPLAAEIVSLVWGNPANFNGFHVLAAFVSDIAIFVLKRDVKLQLTNSWQRYCTALYLSASAKLCGVEQRAPPMFDRATITLGIGSHF